MFGALRKNIQSVQDGITAGLQRLSVSENSSTSTESKVDLTAGSEILELYQTQWATIHHMAEQNSKSAEVVDQKITKLKDECEKQHNQVVEIHSLLAHLPNIMSQLHSTLTTIGAVRGLFEEVEGELMVLEDLNEELRLQENVLDMKMSLTLARENTTHKLNQLRNELSSSHRQKLQEKEKLKEEERKRRETIFESQFQKDLKDYKETGLVKNVPEVDQKSALKLEDVDLDEDKSNLETFLEEPT